MAAGGSYIVTGLMPVAKLSQKHNIQFILNPFFQTKAIQGVYDIEPFLRLNATLRYTTKNGKWSLGSEMQPLHFDQPILETHYASVLP